MGLVATRLPAVRRMRFGAEPRPTTAPCVVHSHGRNTPALVTTGIASGRTLVTMTSATAAYCSPVLSGHLLCNRSGFRPTGALHSSSRMELSAAPLAENAEYAIVRLSAGSPNDSTGPLRPSEYLGSQPESRPAATQVNDGPRHFRIPLLVCADCVAVSKAEDVRNGLCINQILGIHDGRHIDRLHLLTSVTGP